MRKARSAPAVVVTQTALKRKINNLNVKHDADPGDHGFLLLETWRNNHSNQYRLTTTSVRGIIFVTPWLTAGKMMDHIKTKDWRRVLLAAQENKPC